MSISCACPILRRTISCGSTLDNHVNRVHICRRRDGPRETFPALARHGKRRLTAPRVSRGLPGQIRRAYPFIIAIWVLAGAGQRLAFGGNDAQRRCSAGGVHQLAVHGSSVGTGVGERCREPSPAGSPGSNTPVLLSGRGRSVRRGRVGAALGRHRQREGRARLRAARRRDSRSSGRSRRPTSSSPSISAGRSARRSASAASSS